VRVMNDIICAIDRGEVTALVLLNLRAAFDLVDHCMLLDVVHRRFAVEGIQLLWFNSYLINRSQSFFVDDVQSKLICVDFSVLQGSVLEPLEFIYYTKDVVDVFTRKLVRPHLFADDKQDDKQLFRSGKISEIDSIRYQLCCCATDIRDWCSSRRLQLNALKTELQWFGSLANLRKLSSADLTLSVGNDVIQPVTVVRDLGVYLDNDLTM